MANFNVYEAIIQSYISHYSPPCFVFDPTSISPFPHYTTSRKWYYENKSAWIVGFLSGICFLIAEMSESARELFLSLSMQQMEAVQCRSKDATTHDVGFVILSSFGLGRNYFSNSSLGNDLSLASKCSNVICEAALSLSTRYSPIVGCIQSWRNWNKDDPNDYKVIIDTMMNLELLLIASQLEGGKSEWKEIAISHARNTALNHIRKDYTTYHLIKFHSLTGKVVFRGMHQGYNNESTWARGQAWAIYGFVKMYKYTKMEEFLDVALKLTEKYQSLLPHGSFVPVWDFDYPKNPRLQKHQDSSASVIVASALLDLSALLKESNPKLSDSLLLFAISTYRFLFEKNDDVSKISTYLDLSNSFPSVLLHGAYFFLRGHHDQGLIYGDFYLIEGMQKIAQMGLIDKINEGFSSISRTTVTSPNKCTSC